MVFQFYLKAINNLVFCSISNLLLLNKFLMNENQVFKKYIYFPLLSTQVFNIKKIECMVHSAKKFHEWWSKSFEIAS